MPHTPPVIMLIEDDVRISTLYTRILERAGLAVLAFENHTAAEAHIARHGFTTVEGEPIALIVTDYDTHPKNAALSHQHNGLTFAQQFATQAPPIVLFTARSNGDGLDTLSRHGSFAAVYFKPDFPPPTALMDIIAVQYKGSSPHHQVSASDLTASTLGASAEKSTAR